MSGGVKIVQSLKSKWLGGLKRQAFSTLKSYSDFTVGRRGMKENHAGS